jgi:hypothetical protein
MRFAIEYNWEEMAQFDEKDAWGAYQDNMVEDDVPYYKASRAWSNRK